MHTLSVIHGYLCRASLGDQSDFSRFIDLNLLLRLCVQRSYARREVKRGAAIGPKYALSVAAPATAFVLDCLDVVFGNFVPARYPSFLLAHRDLDLVIGSFGPSQETFV